MPKIILTKRELEAVLIAINHTLNTLANSNTQPTLKQNLLRTVKRKLIKEGK